jgi:hypothetical protein
VQLFGGLCLLIVLVLPANFMTKLLRESLQKGTTTPKAYRGYLIAIWMPVVTVFVIAVAYESWWMLVEEPRRLKLGLPIE